MAEGREGDWECSGCKNRNYAFRSFCNRCKQPRLLVDTKTPPNSKWLPRIGDWICSGCTNNNYASREKCKKCGQPKEVAAMPAIAMPGVFVGGQGGLQPRMGLLGSSTFQQSLPPSSVWPLGAFASNTNNLLQLSSVPKDWRNGDWICNCGFHNYSSRAQCKKCNAAPPALGIKRLATDELVHAWDNKRLNAGAGPEQSYSGFGPVTGFLGDELAGLHATYPSGSTTVAPSMQGAMHLPQLQIAPALVGKGVHVAELNTGEREIGCAQIAITIIMHPDLSVIGAKLRKLQPLSQLASLDDMFMTVKYCNSLCGRALV